LALTSGKLTKDILRCEWKEAKCTFADDSNINLVLHISFEALDDPEQNIFESFEPPPQIAGYFDTASGDVAMNDMALAEATENAFDTEQAIMVSQQRPSGTGTGNRDPPCFVELAFSVGRGADDIGSAPNPKEKFPAPKNFEALFRYYDDYDVTTEEDRR
jgi:hypothetical protein